MNGSKYPINGVRLYKNRRNYIDLPSFLGPPAKLVFMLLSAQIHFEIT